MKITATCIECLLSRVQLECALAKADHDLTDKTVASCRTLLSDICDAPLSHPQIASRIHRRAYEKLHDPDPFRELKRHGNTVSIEVCKKIRKDLVSFRDHVLAAIIGNTFDYGVKGHTVTDDFTSFFSKEFESGLVIDDTDKMLPLCSRVVYLSDNCGEIVLDRLLIQFLKSRGAHVTLAVKEIPMLNDATLEDARVLGLDRIVDLLTTNGSRGEIGICLDDIPADLSRAIDSCTVIIAKGMANFESLIEYDGLPPVAYLMAAKCKPVADEVHVPVGSKVAVLRR